MMSVKENIQREANSASEKLREAKDEAAREVKGLVGTAQDTATHYVEEGKEVAAGHLNTFANAVRKASDELSANDQGVAARLVTEAADGLQKVANSISGASVDEMMTSVTAFARRNPGALVIGAVLAGVALGRFAKASSERSHGHGELPYPRGTGSGGYPATPYPGAYGAGAGYRPGGASGSGAAYAQSATMPAGGRPGAMPAGGTSTGAGGSGPQRVGPASSPNSR